MIDNFEKYKHIKSRLILGDTRREIPRYCFVVPTYKRPKQLKRALLSIYNQKNAPQYDVVVVDNDNAMNTETENMIRNCQKSNLYYYKNEENIGLFGNWNRCYELGRGDYCCFCMDDDEISEFYLERIDAVLRERELDCLRVGESILDENDNPIAEHNILEKRYENRPNHLQYVTWKYFLYRGALPPGGMCIKKMVMLKSGGVR